MRQHPWQEVKFKPRWPPDVYYSVDPFEFNLHHRVNIIEECQSGGLQKEKDTVAAWPSSTYVVPLVSVG